MKLETLHKYHEDGWLIKQSHPTLPLTIWNYSPATQYEGKWDEVTLRCRGLITEDITERILIQPFNKFFNYEEVSNEVPWESSEYVYVQDKMDGSLGILFNYKNQWIMATRGSFTSEQAVRGLEILKENYILDTFEPSVAYICEIIYPENRIVVDYGSKKKIVFLGVVLNRFWNWNAGGDDELHWTTAYAYFKMSGIKKSDIVKTEQVFNGLGPDMYNLLKSKNTDNAEGFVLRFHPSNTRVKIKFEEYVRLHRIVTGVSTTTIWETLSNCGSFEGILANTPDEFNNWIRATRDELEKAFKLIEDEYHQIFKVILKSTGANERKGFAELAKQYRHPSILFNMLDGKDYKSIIWKAIKPVYAKPIWSKSDLLSTE